MVCGKGRLEFSNPNLKRSYKVSQTTLASLVSLKYLLPFIKCFLNYLYFHTLRVKTSIYLSPVTKTKHGIVVKIQMGQCPLVLIAKIHRKNKLQNNENENPFIILNTSILTILSFSKLEIPYLHSHIYKGHLMFYSYCPNIQHHKLSCGFSSISHFSFR